MKQNPTYSLLKKMAVAFLFLLMLPALAVYAEQTFTPSIVKFNSEADLDELEAQGVRILRHRGNLALALFPDQSGSTVSAKRRVRTRSGSVLVEAPRFAVPTMDEARKHFGADRIAAGENLPMPYTGKGVVTGFCDIYFDPMHINFFDAQGNSRVKKVVCYDELHGERTEMSTVAEYERWKTDNADGYHATHVAGIMAGSCFNGYHGAAPDSEIVGTVSMLSDVGLLAGAEDIIDYAKSVGKPAVINMSVSSYTGPHDGTSLFSQYVALLGQDAIVCMAAGNEGNHPVSIPFTFSEDKKIIRTFVHSADWAQFDMVGYCDMWSADDRPFKARIAIYDEVAGRTIHECEMLDVSKDFTYRISAESDPEFGKYFTGYIDLIGTLNAENNRRNILVALNAHTTELSGSNTWARYTILLDAAGEPGVHVDLFADISGTRFVRYSSLNPAPGGELSVSDICTGENVVSVGMYVNRNGATNLDGETQDWGLKLGHIQVDSSYGTLLDGTVLPHTAAPGAALISSYSSYYVAAHPERRKNIFASLEKDGKTYYWGREGGTSMATPYVAGYIACWLEANPRLSVSDVLRIISDTNTEAPCEPEDPRNGQGWFHPYEGLLAAIEAAGVSQIASDVSESSAPRLAMNSGNLEIFNPAALQATLTICEPSGKVVMKQQVSGSHQTISLSALGKGIFIATVQTDSHYPATLKIMLR